MYTLLRKRRAAVQVSHFCRRCVRLSLYRGRPRNERHSRPTERGDTRRERNEIGAERRYHEWRQRGRADTHDIRASPEPLSGASFRRSCVPSALDSGGPRRLSEWSRSILIIGRFGVTDLRRTEIPTRHRRARCLEMHEACSLIEKRLNGIPLYSYFFHVTSRTPQIATTQTRQCTVLSRARCFAHLTVTAFRRNTTAIDASLGVSRA